MSIQIISSGSYLPKKVISNLELENKLNLEPGWIFQRTGIQERRVLEDENYLDCCVIAASKAIENAKIENGRIELLITATTTPYQIMPSTATLIQNALGIQQCISFDMQAACAGFMYALVVAESYMRANHLHYALVLGCDAFSRIVNNLDPVTGILFGDGFGAVVLRNDEMSSSRGIFYTHCGTDTSGIDLLKNSWGLAQGFDALDYSSPYVFMNGKEVFKSAVLHFSSEISRAMSINNLLLSDIGCIITHQANRRIITAVCQNLKIPIERCEICLSKHANTSAASIPLALDNLSQRRSLVEGDIILLAGFGAGFTWGTVLFEV